MKELGKKYLKEKSVLCSIQKKVTLANNIHPIFDQLISRAEREDYLNQKAHVFWLTGLSGSGKSTIAKAVERKLLESDIFAQVLDGDNVRSGLCNNLGFTIEDRKENIRRISELAKLYLNSGIVTICSFISPTYLIRDMAKNIIGEDDFSEVFVKASIEECERRDVKGLYKKVRAGEIKGFTGVDSPYEEPVNPAVILDTENHTGEESALELYNYIEKKSKR